MTNDELFEDAPPEVPGDGAVGADAVTGVGPDTERLCECGCGRSLDGKRRQARFFDDTCRKRRGRREGIAKAWGPPIDGPRKAPVGWTEHAKDRLFLEGLYHEGDDSFSSRGIRREIALARPHELFTDENIEPSRRAYRGLGAQQGFMTMLAKQSAGFLMHRSPPPGLGLPPIYPERKAYEAVETAQPIWHYHPDELRKDDIPVYPPEAGPELAGKPLPRKAIHPAAGVESHINSKRKHNGENSQVVHRHRREASYTFPPSAKKTITTRDGRTFRVTDRNESRAMRIDMHPLAAPLFSTARRVIFALEGCLKADAILTVGEAVVSVPSVTLWDAHSPTCFPDTNELEAVARHYFAGRYTVIVPDADWRKNPLVLAQALHTRRRLRGLDINAHIAAPPGCDFEGMHRDCVPGEKCKRNGVDDFLAGGGSIDSLEVFLREAPITAIWRALEEHVRADRMARDVEIVESLSLHARDDGTLRSTRHGPEKAPGNPYSLRTLSTIMGVRGSRVAAKLEALEGAGVIIVEGSVSPANTATNRRLTNRYVDKELGWIKAPTISLREDLRSTTPPTVLLADHQSQFETKGSSHMLQQSREPTNLELLNAIHEVRRAVDKLTPAQEQDRPQLRLVPKADAG